MFPVNDNSSTNLTEQLIPKEMAIRPTSIAFVDSHPIMREGLTSLFSSCDGYVVLGSGSCAADAVSIATQLAPDVLITDLLISGDALDAIARIRRKSQSMIVIAFTASDRVDHAVNALEAGANGYVLKGSTADELKGAIVGAKRGETFVTPTVASKMIGALRKHPTRGIGDPQLSAREDQIVRLLLKGYSNKAIGAQLAITEKTVKHYMTLLIQKLNAANRLEVVLAVQKFADYGRSGNVGNLRHSNNASAAWRTGRN
ncbi:response regulator transcription factor [Aurantimonas sp. HBX-1]|uniref:response regulator n=1 Tax=Aurantimonas sp. HBX-1 TaxID=2906072 RepID=UPI001F314F8B|nr:response regulator transcription factor [Aurantimonas sp. HBX-1]UIJ73386.1 response regulator transcription factor [Aurantimonas sp. HBX-1]